ncbi:MAG: SCO6745 family protein [Acidimicrobiia bacterium]
MTDWSDLSARASMASHRLIGWIYWDPTAIGRYAELGVENGLGWYIASRGAPLAPAGHQAVAAAFYSIHPGFIEGALALAAAATTWERITDVRNDAVGVGLRADAPEICDELAGLADPLWAAVDALPSSGKVLFAAHRHWPRSDDPLVSAWLALNCLREYRGDLHFAVLLSEDLSGTQAGLLHDAYMNYPGDWIPRSRGADDAALGAATTELEVRGLATDGKVNAAGLALRERIEARTDQLTERTWRTFGEARTVRLLELIEPVGPRFMERVDRTAGPEWMPAARDRRPRSGTRQPPPGRDRGGT